MSMLEIKGMEAEAVKVAKDSIMEILTARADQETIRTALQCMMKTFEQPISNVITDCYFYNNADETKVHSSAQKTLSKEEVAQIKKNIKQYEKDNKIKT